jgi:propanol-preferring alcohol dehydrogenase
VVVCTASNAACGQGLGFLKSNKQWAFLKVQPIANAHPAWVIVQQSNLVGSAVGNRRKAMETMDMAARGIVKTSFRLEKMDKLADVFKAMDEGKLWGRVPPDLGG